MKTVMAEKFADNGQHSHWEITNKETGEVLFRLGTTNDGEPFKPGEKIHYAGDIFIVHENHGDSGVVYEPGYEKGKVGFRWNAYGEKCRRVLEK